MPPVRLLNETEVRGLITPREAFEAVREAFVQLHRGRVSLPAVLDLRVPECQGEVHAKGAYVFGSRFFTLKIASGFPQNGELGLPDVSGMSLVADAATGFPACLLLDNGYLTQLRTGAAGALAADLLAREDATQVAMIGAGVQARFQLESLLLVRRIGSVRVASRCRATAEKYAAEMRQRHGIVVEPSTEIAEAVRHADIVVTTTPATKPVVRDAWIGQGVHISAVGSDIPEKQELDSALLARADIVATDELGQATTQGEIHHALAEGLLSPEAVRTLGGLAAGDHHGRSDKSEITIADLTGVGIQDAAVGAVVAQRAAENEVGVVVETGA
jgi:ornithine cyclodeaminase